MTWTLPEPMLTTPDLRPGWAGEPKWDGSPDTSRCLIRVRPQRPGKGGKSGFQEEARRVPLSGSPALPGRALWSRLLLCAAG
ncbi:hypothetical protein FNV58_00095 (plasmid) [Streptomyces sp. RLB1-9]|nr:hypothetical protein FNV58_00095 [Streptomyces sp. RLB1-9]